MIGRMISHYNVTSKIGAGGTGVVYQAEDIRTKQKVAVKVLHSVSLFDQANRDRLLDEATRVARFEHENLCRLLEIDEDETGKLFMVMPFYSGETLAAKISRGRLPIPAVIDIAAQMARGLRAAHEHGVIHRDVSTRNVMITDEGQVKILDFGLSRLADGVTQTGQKELVGTLSYMAPEAFAGAPVDVRLDLWGLGVIAYEMLTGYAPFDGDSPQATMRAIIELPPKRLLSERPDVPVRLESILSKALTKKPSHRYQSAAELLLEFEELKVPSLVQSVDTAPGRELALAVLPFSELNQPGDHQFFAEGMTDDIIEAFSGVNNVRVVARTSTLRYGPSPEDVRRIGSELGVDLVLEGSIRKYDRTVRILARLLDAESGYQIWSKRFDFDGDDVLRLQDEVSRMIATEATTTLTDDGILKRPGLVTTNKDAQRSYLRGRFSLERQSVPMLRAAFEQFADSIAADRAYQLPYAGLADCYCAEGLLGLRSPADAFRDAERTAELGLALGANVPELHHSIGIVRMFYYWDWQGAEEAFRRSINLGLVGARSQAALGLLMALRSRHDEANLLVTEAVDSEPQSPEVSQISAMARLVLGDYQQADTLCGQTLAREPASILPNWVRAVSMIKQRRFDAAMMHCQAAIDRVGRHPILVGVYGATLASQGDRECVAVLDELMSRRSTEHVSPLLIAEIYGALENAALSAQWLQESYDRRDPLLTASALSPFLERVAHDPRIRTLTEPFQSK